MFNRLWDRNKTYVFKSDFNKYILYYDEDEFNRVIYNIYSSMRNDRYYDEDFKNIMDKEQFMELIFNLPKDRLEHIIELKYFQNYHVK